MNLVIVKGNLTRDPELRFTQSGQPVASLSVAVNRRYRNKEGELKEDTDFFRVTAWNKTAENIATYLGKGSPILIQGRLKQSTWETDEGEKRSSVEIVASNVEFLGSKKDTKAEPTKGKEEDIPF